MGALPADGHRRYEGQALWHLRFVDQRSTLGFGGPECTSFAYLSKCVPEDEVFYKDT